MLGIATEAAAAAPVAAATLKNLRLEGVLIPFNVFFFFRHILFPFIYVNICLTLKNLSIKQRQSLYKIDFSYPKKYRLNIMILLGYF